jgi:hypothetical protein
MGTVTADKPVHAANARGTAGKACSQAVPGCGVAEAPVDVVAVAEAEVVSSSCPWRRTTRRSVLPEQRK